MDLPRRLYHWEGAWDHSVAGYVTDYIIFVVSALCITGSIVLYRKNEDARVRRILARFMVYAASLGVAMLAGGLGHHMIDTYDHAPMGKTWGSANSGWMYPWVVAAALMPTAILASLATVFTVADFPQWTQYLLYVLGALVGVLEIVVMSTENLSYSGAASAYMSLLAYFAGGVCAAVLAIRKACSGVKDWMNPFQGRGRIMLGLFFAFVGHCIVAFKPASCTKVGIDIQPAIAEGSECPYPESFNHNAVFHVFVICSVSLVFWGVTAAIPGTDEEAQEAVAAAVPGTDEAAQEEEAA